jgi:hypothetical protein
VSHDSLAMPLKPAFFPPRSRVLVGIMVIIITSGLTYGQWYSTRAPIQAIEWMDRNRSPGDSLAYANAVYHASHARYVLANRWKATGYASTGIAGALLGLIFSALRHRSD